MPTPLADLMAQRNLGVVELARRARVTHATISQILHGKQVPNVRTARLIGSALGVGVDEIVFPGEFAPRVAGASPERCREACRRPKKAEAA